MTGPGKPTPNAEAAKELLRKYRLFDNRNVYTVGTFNQNITMFDQQVRALNLVWALDRSGAVSRYSPNEGNPTRIAVVGGGAAGLTAAAGLLAKRTHAQITVFEKCDTAMPLQHGCDTRWLHPHIYEWPAKGSESPSAGLPVLNWTAGRASDVASRILREWVRVVDDFNKWLQKQHQYDGQGKPGIRVLCNTRYLRVSTDDTGLAVEWTGEPRAPDSLSEDETPPEGVFDRFDIVILATGFGKEQNTETSYWRNDNLAQPRLGQARNTYIVSGSGDGALTDLFRLRIAQFRQDRILHELFDGQDHLVGALRDLGAEKRHNMTFEELRRFWTDGPGTPDNTEITDQGKEVLKRLRNRLRDDTTVLLSVLQRGFSRLFEGKRVSFQNKLLAYLLYQCGAFTLIPVEEGEDLSPLVDLYGVRPGHIVRRYGVETKECLRRALDGDLQNEFVEHFMHSQATVRTAPTEIDAAIRSRQQVDTHIDKHAQPNKPIWPGDYFDIHADDRYAKSRGTSESERASDMQFHWGVEYLPSPTEVVATALCSAVAGVAINALSGRLPSAGVRAALFRTLDRGTDIVLQQCCRYRGVESKGVDDKELAGRTFPTTKSVMAAAYGLQEIVYTRHANEGNGEFERQLRRDIKETHLNNASLNIMSAAKSIIAIPLLYRSGSASKEVLGVLYIDSTAHNAFRSATGFTDLTTAIFQICEQFLNALPTVAATAGDRITTTEFWGEPKGTKDAGDDKRYWERIKKEKWRALQTEQPGRQCETRGIRNLNFEVSDYTPVETGLPKQPDIRRGILRSGKSASATQRSVHHLDRGR